MTEAQLLTIPAIQRRPFDLRLTADEWARIQGEKNMTRDLSNENTASASSSTGDIKVSGNPDAWELVCKASSASQGWMKSTKRMRVDGGWLYQVTTEHRVNGAVVACAEALAFASAP